jgi:hypothetical protein
MIMVFGGNPENRCSANSGLLETSRKLYGSKGFQNRIERARKQSGLLTGDYGDRARSKIFHALRTRAELFLLLGKNRAQPVEVCFVRTWAFPGEG